LKIEAGNVSTRNNLAFLLATCADASVRNGPRALELAEQARLATGGTNSVVLATLATAYAETGQFANAVKMAEQGLQLAAAHPYSAFAQALHAQLELYLKGVPYRERAPSEPDRQNERTKE